MCYSHSSLAFAYSAAVRCKSASRTRAGFYAFFFSRPSSREARTRGAACAAEGSCGHGSLPAATGGHS